MQRIERVLVRWDDGAAGVLLRVGLGYLTGTAWLQLIGTRGPGWTVGPFFLAVLVALRVLPALVRRLGRFSEAVRSTWAERRLLAKRYDSYQWQKLVWIGVGLSLSIVASGQRTAPLLVLALFCLASGGLGLVVWRHRAARSEGARGRSHVKDIITSGQRAEAAALNVRSEA